MISRILFLAQIPGSHQRNRDGIPKNHLDRSGSHRSQIKRTQFPLQRQMHIHIANRRESIAFNGRERKPARMPREIRVWEILLATKPDLPTPEKKIAPLQRRSVWVKDKVVLLGFEEVEKGGLVNLLRFGIR
ncbi:hypothetical protein SADUNF_Sadunf02G0031100 [Salix dunnii]|uniref:Uncharacterized protein n=1 Tax=Salix dunnii TaxID=1413687 RepID=A0A835TFB7_9ROSI|nr:hypothetical protein SADUNF_Sadunf02G0031100 [Salix dunnii]